jgi:hypothetical protein
MVKFGKIAKHNVVEGTILMILVFFARLLRNIEGELRR